MDALIQAIKYAALGAVEATQPADIFFGTVTAEDPDLTIRVEAQDVITLTKEFLVKTRNVTDYYVDMTVDHVTEDTTKPMTAKMGGGGGDPSFSSHNHKHSHIHPYKGRKPFLVHSRLLVGEKVILARMAGGQKFIILDRIGGENAVSESEN